MMSRSTYAVAALLLAAAVVAPSPAQAFGGFLDGLANQFTLTASSPVGEGNPYGIALIPRTLGKLIQGNYLLTNWNGKDNAGQGRNIIQMDQLGRTSVFATIPNNPPPAGCNGTQGNGGTPITQVGLTMALAIFKNGWVVVGNTPINVGGGAGVAATGCLIYLDFFGNVVSTLNGGLVNGPWGATLKDDGNTANLFVSMALGTNPASTTPQTGAAGGYVVRYPLNVPFLNGAAPAGTFITPAANRQVIASGFTTTPGVTVTNPAGANQLCADGGPGPCLSGGIEGGTVGPSGVAYVAGSGANADVLYIADTQGNKIVAVKNAINCPTTGTNACATTVVTADNYLVNPVGVNLITANGNLLTANGGMGSLVEFTPLTSATPGVQVAAKVVDVGNGDGAGNLFNAVATTSPCNKPRVIFNNDGQNNIMVLDA